MKHVLIMLAVMTLVFGASFLIGGIVRKRIKRKPSAAVHVLICTGAALAVMLAGSAVFLSVHYSPGNDAISVLSDNSGAAVTKTDFGYMIDGSGEKAALVFYPGAKVDTEAYLPLMKQIADGGVDCFVLDLPMRMAIFDPYGADDVLSHYDYDVWITSGHSMGGVIAARYAAQHSDIDAVVLLASYTTEPLPEKTALLSVYGTNDMVLEREAYKSSKRFFPEDFTEVVIDGGNHAQFGDYGEQSGDGEAAISAKEQQRITAGAVTEFASKLIGE